MDRPHNVTVSCPCCGASLVTGSTTMADILAMKFRGWNFECGLDGEGWWALFFAPEDAGTGREEHLATGATFDDAVRASKRKAVTL